MSKLLAEFLQEQQEPFALDVYLLERGYSLGTTLGAVRKSTRFVKKRRRAIPNCSRFVRAVFSTLALNNNHTFKSSGKSIRANNRDSVEEHEKVDEFSLESGTTVYDSCSECDAEDAEYLENGNFEGDAERELKWRSLEENNKQLSPVSVLDETESDEGSSPFHQKQNKIKTTQGETSTSISQSKSTYANVPQLVDSSSYTQYMINKRELQQTKQLLIDCVREVIEKQRRKDDKNGEQLKRILGVEELWKVVCENVWLWSQDSIDETNVVHLLHCDFMASAEEWRSGCEKEMMEIAMEIGDVILEGIINEVLIKYIGICRLR